MRYYETPVIVRFNEVDAFGVVWHGHYSGYLEIGRLELSKKFGLSLEEMKEMNLYAPVVEMKIRYKSFARCGDEIIVKTTVLPTEKASLTFRYILERKTDTAVVAEAETTHILLTLEGKMLYQIPDILKQRLKKMIDYLYNENHQ